ncbi:MAG: ATP-dependent Clp protease proteolytic subunit [Candidatus Saccharibacteria bacterium]|uniref:ATP-dependent Clp protease proteolytic subunit n=1 Tax=Candidatus Nanosyncoccus alces TaxID=2171997 RepID=A0ABY0FND0_9BACT|nr:ATP-dependent Clp protease proteolytic subunit [Candidatus Nanosyncoccus alces]MBQ2643590.1 ATP-dependent Clp protease proteolytic subunit [Candidatus Saccharibacteria bacterium]MDO4398774.1 ATP-dependent Clp protease proteolytic subunit [Candidatus Saccharibacteria bacterium]RYC74522.1 ATP-dependent Clp protease proteolytic subunit [Candidatus Nanosyncoccus alces]
MLHKIPDEIVRIGCTIEEYQNLRSTEERRLYLSRAIYSLDDEDSVNEYLSTAAQIVQLIFEFNAEDRELPPDQRRPIKLFINSPGGDVAEGFPLVAAIELSKTPVYTINIGEWNSMAFLIGITGHKRFALPYTKFLLHEGSLFAGGSTNKVQDRVEFDKRFEQEIVKEHILKHSNMTGSDYDALARVEYYMLPEDAIKRHFIDEIIEDIEAVL